VEGAAALDANAGIETKKSAKTALGSSLFIAFHILFKRPITGSSEPNTVTLTIRSMEYFCGKRHETKKDGIVFNREARFDDKTTEHDLASGILFSSIRHYPAQQPFRPHESKTAVPKFAFWSFHEIDQPTLLGLKADQIRGFLCRLNQP
jgi:hypothetical protein